MMHKKRVIAFLIAFLLVSPMLSSFAAKIQDPYEAYNLDRYDREINYRMVTSPPEVVIIKPVYIEYGRLWAPINYGEMQFSLGGQATPSRFQRNSLIQNSKILSQSNPPSRSSIS